MSSENLQVICGKELHLIDLSHLKAFRLNSSCKKITNFIPVADMKNEKKILTAMDNICDQMPGEFATECHQFVEEYGPAFVALIIQQIDPSQVMSNTVFNRY